MTEETLSLRPLLASCIIFLYFFPIQLIHQLNDYAQDKAMGQQNTVQVLGVKKSVSLIFFSTGIFLIFNILMGLQHFIRTGAVVSGLLFAAGLIFYLMQINQIENKVLQNQLRRLKMVGRILSILYGLGLGVSFFWNI